MEKKFATERRKYHRFNVDLPVKYGSAPIFFRNARAANASEGGLLVYLPEEMRIGQHLTLKLFFSSRSEFNILETFAQVVWKNIHLRKNWTWDYCTGVKFVDIPPEHKNELKKFLVNIGQKLPHTA